jgi:hypothetical protein
METKFTVAMNAEEKKAGNTHEVVIDIDFDNADEDTIRKAALANYTVGLQAQIRNNWDKFLEDGTPETMVFGDTLYEGKRTRVMTPDEAIKKLLDTGMTVEEILEKYQSK